MSQGNHRCEPMYDENGELIAVAHVDPNMSDRARAALGELVEVARRKFAADLDADPSIGERQAESIRRIRARVNRESRIVGES